MELFHKMLFLNIYFYFIVNLVNILGVCKDMHPCLFQTCRKSTIIRKTQPYILKKNKAICFSFTRSHHVDVRSSLSSFILLAMLLSFVPTHSLQKTCNLGGNTLQGSQLSSSHQGQAGTGSQSYLSL